MLNLHQLIEKYGQPDALIDHWDSSSNRFAIWGFEEKFMITNNGRCMLNGNRIDKYPLDAWQDALNSWKAYDGEMSAVGYVSYDMKNLLYTHIPFKKSNGKMAGIRLTTARYYTPSGESIQGKGIDPDIIVEQGNFESAEYKRYSESDLKGSLDNEKDENENNIEEISPQEERLAIDFQLAQAVDLIKGLNIYQESFSQ